MLNLNALYGGMTCWLCWLFKLPRLACYSYMQAVSAVYAGCICWLFLMAMRAKLVGNTDYPGWICFLFKLSGYADYADRLCFLCSLGGYADMLAGSVGHPGWLTDYPSYGVWLAVLHVLPD
jgi:hypothetical protein